jgi:hypothetical protein
VDIARTVGSALVAALRGRAGASRAPMMAPARGAPLLVERLVARPRSLTLFVNPAQFGGRPHALPARRERVDAALAAERAPLFAPDADDVTRPASPRP